MTYEVQTYDTTDNTVYYETVEGVMSCVDAFVIITKKYPNRKVISVQEKNNVAMTDKSTKSQVVRSKIDVFTWVDPNDKEKTERVEVTVDDLGVWITSCTGNVREEMNIDNKDLAIALAKAILEGYGEK
jgi:hypothetical protein